MKASILLLISSGIMATMSHAGDSPAPFKITTKRPDDTVEVRSEKGVVTLTVKSPSGMSHAVLEREEEKWPQVVVLQLRLKGLENFQISNGTVRIDGAVSSQNGKVRVWKDTKEDSPLNEKSPFWIEVRPIGGDGKPATTFPLQNGHFHLILPKALFEGNPKSITIRWIDFYRN